MLIEKTAKATLTAVELDVGDRLAFTLANGQTRTIELQKVSKSLVSTECDPLLMEKPRAKTIFKFFCRLTIDGVQVNIGREVGTDRSFYAPREVLGLRIWFDAISDIFDTYVTETHGSCKPRKQARFAIQDATLRDCPVKLHPWCPLPAGGLRISDCYNGDDCWLGAYFGASAHGGLDINHPAGTPLFTPFACDEQFLYNSLSNGDNNNRWQMETRWPDGSIWRLQVAHVVRLVVAEHQPLLAGMHFADGAGVYIGDHEHSHFVFMVMDGSHEIRLDPWILFYWMYRDNADAVQPRKA